MFALNKNQFKHENNEQDKNEKKQLIIIKVFQFEG